MRGDRSVGRASRINDAVRSDHDRIRAFRCGQSGIVKITCLNVSVAFCADRTKMVIGAFVCLNRAEHDPFVRIDAFKRRKRKDILSFRGIKTAVNGWIGPGGSDGHEGIFAVTEIKLFDQLCILVEGDGRGRRLGCRLRRRRGLRRRRRNGRQRGRDFGRRHGDHGFLLRRCDRFRNDCRFGGRSDRLLCRRTAGDQNYESKNRYH